MEQVPPRFGASPLIAVTRNLTSQVGAAIVKTNDSVFLGSKRPIKAFDLIDQDIDSNPSLEPLNAVKVEICRERASLLGKPPESGLQLMRSLIAGPNG
jgi:hypothetical protein